MSAHSAPLSRTAGGIHEEEFSVVSENLQTSMSSAAASPLASVNAKEDVEALLTNECGKLEISEALVKSGEFFIKFGAKNDEFTLKIGKFC